MKIIKQILLLLFFILICGLSFFLLPQVSSAFDFKFSDWPLYIDSSFKEKDQNKKTIIVKFTDKNLDKTISQLQEEKSQKLKNLVSKNNKIIPVLNKNNTAKEQTEINKNKFPFRNKKAPENSTIPDLSLLYEFEVDDYEVEEVLNNLKENQEIEYAEAIDLKPTEADLEPNDLFYNTASNIYETYSNFWALNKISLNAINDSNNDSGWDISTGSKQVVVAVYGTGIDYNHPDLRDNIWINPGEDIDKDRQVWDEDDLNGIDDDGNGYVDDLHGWSFLQDSNNVYDDGSSYSGHDTMVAGIIGASGNNKLGSVGVNFKVKLMAVKGSVTQSILYAVDNGADIINISYAGQGIGLKDVVDYAWANGTMVIFSADNYSREINYQPSRSDKTILVGATTTTDEKASFSSYGKRLDFTAPGINVFSLIPTNLQGKGVLTNNSSFDLKADSLNNPYLVFYDWNQINLKYGKQVNKSWQFETIETKNMIPLYISLAFDNQNSPHMSFYDWNNKRLVYLSKSKKWKIDFVTNNGDQGFYSDLKLDSNDNPYIAYIDKFDKTIKLAFLNKNKWQVENVTSMGDFNLDLSSLSLALDNNNTPHISFYKGGSGDLVYASKVNTTWNVEVVDTDGNTGLYSDLIIDGDNNPHIVYTEISSFAVNYAQKLKGKWQIEKISGDNYAGFYTNNISLDNKNQPHITTSFYNLNKGGSDLLYIFKKDNNWQLTPLEGTEEKLSYNHKLVLLNNNAYILAASRNNGLYEINLDDKNKQIDLIVDWGNPYGFISGTSASAPLVSGLAALVISAHPNWNLAQIYWALAAGAEDLGNQGHDNDFGWGRIDAKSSMYYKDPLFDNIKPVASFSNFANNINLTKGKTEIRGTASDENLTYYSLYFRLKGNKNWNALLWFERQPVINDLLTVWDTTYLYSGIYELRLEVNDWYQNSENIIEVNII